MRRAHLLARRGTTLATASIKTSIIGEETGEEFALPKATVITEIKLDAT